MHNLQTWKHVESGCSNQGIFELLRCCVMCRSTNPPPSPPPPTPDKQDAKVLFHSAETMTNINASKLTNCSALVCRGISDFERYFWNQQLRLRLDVNHEDPCSLARVCLCTPGDQALS